MHIRKKAMKQFEDKLVLLQKKISDYPKDELEFFVAKEEKDIKKYYNKTVFFSCLTNAMNLLKKFK